MKSAEIITAHTGNAAYITDRPRPSSKVAAEVLRKAYGIKETAGALGVCIETVYNWIAAERLRARKLGKRTIILASDLDEFLESLPDMRPGEGPPMKKRPVTLPTV